MGNGVRGLMVLVLALGLAAGSAAARELDGVQVPETLTEGDRPLTLIGSGVRKKFFFSVYVGALYLATPTGAAETARFGEEPKALTLSFLRDVDQGKLRKELEEGFFNNAQEQLPQLQGRIDRLFALFPAEVEDGQTVTFAYLPGRGTRVHLAGREAVIEGADFMEALWGVWIGDVPADHDLKRALLGRP